MPGITSLCAPQDYADLHPADVLGCSDPNPWWSNRCTCKDGEALVHAFLSYDIYNLLPYWEQDLRTKISKMVFPLSEFSGRSRRQILESVLESLGLTNHLPLDTKNGNDFPRVSAVCAQLGLHPQDELECPGHKDKMFCTYPIDVVDTKEMMNAITDKHALEVAQELVEIIENSLIENNNFGDNDTRAQVFSQILGQMRADLEAELRFGHGNREELEKLLKQIEYLSFKIFCNGQLPVLVTICL